MEIDWSTVLSIVIGGLITIIVAWIFGCKTKKDINDSTEKMQVINQNIKDFMFNSFGSLISSINNNFPNMKWKMGINDRGIFVEIEGHDEGTVSLEEAMAKEE